MGWIKDPKVEHELKTRKIKWSVQDIKLRDIDRKKSQQTQFRAEHKLDDGIVMKYAAAIENGAAMPMVVVQKHGTACYLLGGNHRVAAADLISLDSMPAYVVDISDEFMLDVLPAVLNNIEGQGPKINEMAKLAVWTAERYGIPLVEIAKQFNLRSGYLQDVAAAYRVRNRLLELGVPGVANLKDTSLRQMHKFAKNDNVLRALGHLASGSGRGGAAISNIIAELSACRTEGQQIAKIEEIAQRERDIPAPFRKPRDIRTRFLTQLSSLENTLRGIKSIGGLHITGDEEREFTLRRLERLINKFRQLGAKTDAKNRDTIA